MTICDLGLCPLCPEAFLSEAATLTLTLLSLTAELRSPNAAGSFEKVGAARGNTGSLVSQFEQRSLLQNKAVLQQGTHTANSTADCNMALPDSEESCCERLMMFAGTCYAKLTESAPLETKDISDLSSSGKQFPSVPTSDKRLLCERVLGVSIS